MRQGKKSAGAGKAVGGDQKAGSKAAGCASGECPVRKNAWLIMCGVYAGWLIFLLVLGLRQISH